jgi:hypothetical protein
VQELLLRWWWWRRRPADERCSCCCLHIDRLRISVASAQLLLLLVTVHPA